MHRWDYNKKEVINSENLGLKWISLSHDRVKCKIVRIKL
jgi:hypothetical protein